MKWQNRARWIAVPLTIFILLFMLFPFFVMLSTMLKSGKDVYTTPPIWLPTHIEWSSFTAVWTQDGVLGRSQLHRRMHPGADHDADHAPHRRARAGDKWSMN